MIMDNLIDMFSPETLPVAFCRSTRRHPAEKPLRAFVSYPQIYGLAKSHDTECKDPVISNVMIKYDVP